MFAILRLAQSRTLEVTSCGRLLQAVLLMSAVCASQKTYARSCDCEYMVDGKCAYTILLPVGSGSVSSNCDVTQTTTQAVSDLANNVSFLWQWMANQTNHLSELQRTVIALQSDVISKTRADCPTSVNNPTVTSLNDSTVEQAASSALSVLAQVSRLAAEVDHLRHLPSACINKSRMFSGPNRLGPSIAKINVSSLFDDTFTANSVSLDNTQSPAAWCPKEPNLNEWIEFDVGTERWIFGVITKGRFDVTQWVTSYNVQYHPVGGGSSIDKNDPSFWRLFTDAVDEVLTFPGNVDTWTAQINMLWKPVLTRYVRILPVTANTVNMCMRADIIGCTDQ